MIKYYAQLTTLPDDISFKQSFVFGSTQLDFEFFWCEDVTEQLDIYRKALKSRAQADPLIEPDTGAITREYTWLDYYLSIPHASSTEVEEWITEQTMLPQSLLGYRDNTSLLANAVYERCLEAEEIQSRLEPLQEQECWHVVITDAEGRQVTGVVRLGGWLNEQDDLWRVQFTSEKSEISKNDLLLVTIHAEVKE